MASLTKLRFPTGANSGVQIAFEGPIFAPNRDKVFDHNVRDLMAELARWGQERIRGRIEAAGHPRTALTYQGRVKALTGHEWRRTAVVSPVYRGKPVKEAIATLARAHEVEYGQRPHHPWPRKGKPNEPLGRGKGSKSVAKTRSEMRQWWTANGSRILKGLT